MKKHEILKTEGNKVIRQRKNCPRCGPGVFMAQHKDRNYCGRCKYTEFKGKASQEVKKTEKQENPQEKK